ncbi:MAG: DUF444 family protein [Chitinivibrionales bacterium]|nr:DUF444 family protein [Chitinivibrionales bacterium]
MKPKRHQSSHRAKVLSEKQGPQSHEAGRPRLSKGIARIQPPPQYLDYADAHTLQAQPAARGTSQFGLTTIEELLDRDRQREQDGFPRKIRVGRLVKPGKGDKNAIVVIPATVEEKFIHDNQFNPGEEQEAGGTGDSEEGEVIGEQPVRPRQGEGGEGAGEGQDGSHEIESNAYDLGKILTEKFELPNLQDKGAKRSLTKYTYDITDTNRGFGQALDKKATLRRILDTNFALGRISDITSIDPADLLVSPGDRMYRILSREKDYESQAMVFFVRDYSGSMAGKVTELVVAQHVLIYSWLLYQYAKRVETRFILHDTQAKEVPDFYSYYNSKVAGGTHVSAAYKLVNDIVENENLRREYNIYVFHGTDGDDWDTTGEKAIPELRTILEYASRVGVTVAMHSYNRNSKTEVQKYLEKSGLLKEMPNLLRMDVINEDAEEQRLIDGIRNLISEKAPTT